MGRKMFFSLLVASICLGSGLSMTVMAQSPVQDPSKIWLRTGPYLIEDTPAITEQLNIARELAGDDWYFLQIQRLQCGDIDDTYTIVRTPGANVIPPDSQSTGRKEVSAVPTKVFDNVYYVGGMEVGGWVIDTGAGYIMLDSGYDYSYDEFLIPNMKKLGLDPRKVKYMLITHAGPDHVGAAKKFQDAYGTEIIFNKVIEANPFYLPHPPDKTTVMKDGDMLTLGNTTVTMVYTPRTPGGDGFSYFIPVRVHGKRHMWATFGNTGYSDIATWRNSMAHFLTYVDKLKPDIAISSHPFVDGSVRRMELIRECRDGRGRQDVCGPHNPFLIGKEAARRYFEIMDQCAVVQGMRRAAGLDGNGFLACPKGQALDPKTNTCK